MAEWDRQIPWRQGHALTAETVSALQLLPEGRSADSVVVLIISHDCDIASDPSTEPIIEAIAGTKVAGSDGNFTNGKNSRRLHLNATEADAAIWIELIAGARVMIPKADLAKHAPCSKISLSPADKNRLQVWLAARYRRSAFPDKFDFQLSKTGVYERLAKILKPLDDHVIAVFFDVDEGDEREHADEGDPFTLTIDLLYSTEIDPATAEAATLKACEEIAQAFRDRCFDAKTKTWKAVELLGCSAISDQALTYADSLKLKRWNADHISLRAEPAKPMITEA
jgi:hypothetical protein